ncbi:MAG: helix-turn-helix transcriptional regulator [Verrucomicrobiae bacterium]|nr:helix-turn-helix transcriptional regulator [Verrucomicrobiae bacterium]
MIRTENEAGGPTMAMALFLKKNAIRENRIENVGRWPIRLTDFFLVDDYEFPPSRFTEVFLVRAGNFLHETESGTQAVRTGTAIVHHPESRHVVKQPDQVKLTRIRFLPEWFSGDFRSIIESPDALGLFFVPTFFEIPQESRVQVFTCRESQLSFVFSLFDLLHQSLRTGRHGEPVSRVTLLEILLLLGDEYHVYWRGGNRLAIPEEVNVALQVVETAVASGGRLPIKLLQSESGQSQEELNQAFRKHLGLSLTDYAQGRRVRHAAQRLLGSTDPVDSISANFGFSDRSQMDKAFDGAFGMAPDAYRMKFGINGIAMDAGGKDTKTPA